VSDLSQVDNNISIISQCNQDKIESNIVIWKKKCYIKWSKNATTINNLCGSSNTTLSIFSHVSIFKFVTNGKTHTLFEDPHALKQFPLDSTNVKCQYVIDKYICRSQTYI
jgi:hypothetical protein